VSISPPATFARNSSTVMMPRSAIHSPGQL
jgi:hypothetical protein